MVREELLERALPWASWGWGGEGWSQSLSAGRSWSGGTGGGAAAATASGTELGPLGAPRSRGSVRFAILPLAGSCRRSAFK